MSEAIRLHHKPELAQTGPPFAAVISLADKIANDVAAGEDADAIATKYPELLSLLELDPEPAAQAIQRYVYAINDGHSVGSAYGLTVEDFGEGIARTAELHYRLNADNPGRQFCAVCGPPWPQTPLSGPPTPPTPVNPLDLEGEGGSK